MWFREPSIRFTDYFCFTQFWIYDDGDEACHAVILQTITVSEQLNAESSLVPRFSHSRLTPLRIHHRLHLISKQFMSAVTPQTRDIKRTHISLLGIWLHLVDTSTPNA